MEIWVNFLITQDEGGNGEAKHVAIYKKFTDVSDLECLPGCILALSLWGLPIATKP